MKQLPDSLCFKPKQEIMCALRMTEDTDTCGFCGRFQMKIS